MGTHPGCPLSAPLFILHGRLAQLVRAAALHAVGLGFESLVAHQEPASQAGFFMLVSPA